MSGVPTIKEQTLTAVWPESINDTLSKVLKRGDQKPYGFYSLRHTFATDMLRGAEDQKGADLHTVQAMMGHKIIKTTERSIWSRYALPRDPSGVYFLINKSRCETRSP